MRTEVRLPYSPALGHHMEHRRYTADAGVTGQPLLAFPSMNGRVGDWEGFGMVEAIRHLIDAGRVTLYVTDGIDWQSWTADDKGPGERALRHAEFDRYLVEELLPLIRGETGRETVWTTGCSMGAFHSTSLLVRHPDLVDGLIAMSGVYQPRRFIGEYSDAEVRAASPLDRLPGETDPERLALYRRARIVLCVGQGAWEDEMVVDTRAMEALLAEKEIPAFVDYWGLDVNHDWPWWQKMLPYHLERLLA
ncbi:MAG TPA: alpha/beta hydrolase-fold protein [Candidatus Limnocylindria bacterium]|nr:alpha/beta hydrolase-fold protein [Candidatus Limnocylindria bacterium]